MPIELSVSLMKEGLKIISSVNKMDYEMVQSGNMLSIEDIVYVLDIELIGLIINDKSITVSTNKGEPIVLNENSKIGQSFKQIAMRIMGKEIPFETKNPCFVIQRVPAAYNYAIFDPDMFHHISYQHILAYHIQPRLL